MHLFWMDRCLKEQAEIWMEWRWSWDILLSFRFFLHMISFGTTLADFLFTCFMLIWVNGGEYHPLLVKNVKWVWKSGWVLISTFLLGLGGHLCFQVYLLFTMSLMILWTFWLDFAVFFPLFSVAPMMEWTDHHYRTLARIISKHAWLYTEMIATETIVHQEHNLVNFCKQWSYLDYFNI